MPSLHRVPAIGPEKPQAAGKKLIKLTAGLGQPASLRVLPDELEASRQRPGMVRPVDRFKVGQEAPVRIDRLVATARAGERVRQPLCCSQAVSAAGSEYALIVSKILLEQANRVVLAPGLQVPASQGNLCLSPLQARPDVRIVPEEPPGQIRFRQRDSSLVLARARISAGQPYLQADADRVVAARRPDVVTHGLFIKLRGTLELFSGYQQASQAPADRVGHSVIGAMLTLKPGKIPLLQFDHARRVASGLARGSQDGLHAASHDAALRGHLAPHHDSADLYLQILL